VLSFRDRGETIMSDHRGQLPKITVDMLRENRLFHGFADDVLQTLVRELPPRVVNPGEIVISEGEMARQMFVVVNGELEVLTHGVGERADVRLALLGPGDWVGEMAILDVQPRSATVRALAPSMLLCLTAHDVARLIQDRDVAHYARLMVNIARELGHRLRVADRIIAQSSAALAKQYVLESMRPPAPPKSQ
jgi:CRP-like cAMP-binding protein